jgi:hypothetical protein
MPWVECDVEDGTCQELEELFDFTHPQMSHHEALKYKYVLDMYVETSEAVGHKLSRLSQRRQLVVRAFQSTSRWRSFGFQVYHHA